VLHHLLGNAVKYSPDGGEVTISVGREATRDGREWATLSVRDQGLGIPAADLPHVFDRFHRAANVVGPIRGTGLGLSSARQVIEQHGGTVGIESTEGEGSTFTIRLPLAGADESAPTSGAPPMAPRHGPERAPSAPGVVSGTREA
jgi:signal transduction histidine kinase